MSLATQAQQGQQELCQHFAYPRFTPAQPGIHTSVKSWISLFLAIAMTKPKSAHLKMLRTFLPACIAVFSPSLLPPHIFFFTSSLIYGLDPVIFEISSFCRRGSNISAVLELGESHTFCPSTCSHLTPVLLMED